MRWIAAGALCIGVMLGAAAISGTASAAKPEREVIELDCGEDGTLTVELVPGNGQFTPARIVGGGVFHPVAFENVSGTFMDTEGNVETFQEPDASKGAPRGKEYLDCSFMITFEDPEGTGTFGGDVRGWISGG